MNPEVIIPITLFDKRANFPVILPVEVPFKIADWHQTAKIAPIIKEAPKLHPGHTVDKDIYICVYL
jgi:hypothetical protein